VGNIVGYHITTSTKRPRSTLHVLATAKSHYNSDSFCELPCKRWMGHPFGNGNEPYVKTWVFRHSYRWHAYDEREPRRMIMHHERVAGHRLFVQLREDELKNVPL
jgi:hypothetical protein